MKIIKYAKNKDNSYKVYLDNKTSVNLYDKVILSDDLLIKKEVSENKLKELLKKNNDMMAYYEAVKYISIKMRTKEEVIDYLKKKYDSRVITETVVRLDDEGLINEENYVRAYVNDQINLSNKGYYKIKNELVKKNLDEMIILNYLDVIDKKIWLERIDKIVKKKFMAKHNESAVKYKEKVFIYISNLGYKKEMIREVMEKYDTSDDSLVIKKEYEKNYRILSRKYVGKELEYKLLMKMLSKGFNYEDIKKIMK